ncbi:MAG: hypothetical protein FJ090_08560 [Deltaproteobacteria bacterium]|nr:hypothetical protein [Deltaproteobacteria bacterium]
MLMFTLALAQERDPADAPDSDALLASAQAQVRNLPGCWAMQGDSRDRWDAGIFGEGDRHWVLAGRLVDGLWQDFTFTAAPDNQTPPDENDKRRSMFGRYPDAEADQEAGRQSVLQALSDDVSLQYVERDGAGWRLTRTLRGGTALKNTLVLHYDAALRPWRWAVSIVDPVVVKGDRGKAKIVRMEAVLEADERGAPRSETFTGTFARWPFKVDVSAVTRWTAGAC